MALARRFCFRIILDEALSLGTLGATGRGALEYHGLPTDAVELRLCSFENALGCVGGACCSDWDLVEYQRLSGAGYCFSAAAPPFLSACASFNISYLSSNPALVERLAERTAQLTQAVGVLPARNGVELSSAPESPVVYVRHKAGPAATQALYAHLSSSGVASRLTSLGVRLVVREMLSLTQINSVAKAISAYRQ